MCGGCRNQGHEEVEPFWPFLKIYYLIFELEDCQYWTFSLQLGLVFLICHSYLAMVARGCTRVAQGMV
jgi:hypothetical protein